MPNAKHKEGELYKALEVFGNVFEVRYGYYEAFERERFDPIPIYPDLEEEPRFSPEGERLVTQMQDMCENAVFRRRNLRDPCCGNCKYFLAGDDLFGKCVHPQTRQEPQTPSEST